METVGNSGLLRSAAVEFEKWKVEEERRSVSAFIQRRGMDKHNVIRYYCRRSGVYVTRGVGKRQTKSQGSCKVGSTCPAYIKAAFTPTGEYSWIYDAFLF